MILLVDRGRPDWGILTDYLYLAPSGPAARVAQDAYGLPVHVPEP
jgi:hypothetical protein